MRNKKQVCLGAIAGAHGVRGAVRIKSFTENPADVASYGPVFSEDGKRQFMLSVKQILKGDIVLASSPDILTREDAERLKGERLYIPRDCLPETDEDEFYVEDLIGLSVIAPDGAPCGRISAVHNFGAGDIVEIVGAPDVKGALLIEFTIANFPDVDFDDGQIAISDDALKILTVEDTRPEG